MKTLLQLGASIAATLLIATRASASGCVVRGNTVSIRGLVVYLDHGRKLWINTRKTPVLVTTPTWPETTYEVRVDGAIAFSSTRRNIWYRLKSATIANNRMVHLTPGALLVNTQIVDGNVEGSIVMNSGCMTGEFENDKAYEMAGPVRVPCANLGLFEEWPDDLESRHTDNDYALSDESASVEFLRGSLPPARNADWWLVRGQNASFQLSAMPRLDAPTLTVWDTFARGYAVFSVRRVDERGDWLKVSRNGDETSIVGWIPRSRLVPIPGERRNYGACARGGISAQGGSSYVPQHPTGLYMGTARVAVGTRVFADPRRAERGESAWATVRKAVPMQVRYLKGEDWVELIEIPGLEGVGALAWVPFAAVHFPP